jgi:hypothetical protein
MEQKNTQPMEMTNEKVTQLLVDLYEHIVGNKEDRDGLSGRQVATLQRQYLNSAYHMLPICRKVEIDGTTVGMRATPNQVPGYQRMKYEAKLIAVGRREQKWTPEYLIETEMNSPK